MAKGGGTNTTNFLRIAGLFFAFNGAYHLLRSQGIDLYFISLTRQGSLVYGLIVLILLYPLTAWLGPGSEQFFGTFNVFSYFIDAFTFLFMAVIGSGIALGAVSSYLAVRRYLYT